MAASNSALLERPLSMPFGAFLPRSDVAPPIEGSTRGKAVEAVGEVYCKHKLTLPTFNAIVPLNNRTEWSTCL